MIVGVPNKPTFQRKLNILYSLYIFCLFERWQRLLSSCLFSQDLVLHFRSSVLWEVQTRMKTNSRVAGLLTHGHWEKRPMCMFLGTSSTTQFLNSDEYFAWKKNKISVHHLYTESLRTISHLKTESDSAILIKKSAVCVTHLFSLHHIIPAFTCRGVCKKKKKIHYYIQWKEHILALQKSRKSCI